jgi:transcriptional regulator with XRE-family HTH domain
MLLKVLRTVAQGGVHNQRELARRLGVSEGLLAQMLQGLARMGYLRPMAEGCDACCAACPLAKTCAVGGPTRVWALTERGATIAGELSLR